MKKWITGVSFLAFAGVLAWLGLRDAPQGEGREGGPSWVEMMGLVSPQEKADGKIVVRTKVADREDQPEYFTHRPDRLQDFRLPAINIDGLALEGALQKLMAAYRDACEKSGETVLPLEFAVPAGTYPSLSVRLPDGSFQAAVRLLGSLSGMKVDRDGLVYRFDALAGDRKPVDREIAAPPDLESRLRELAKLPEGPRMSLNDCLVAIGFDLDPTTRLSFDANKGALRIATSSAVDEAAVSALLRQITDRTPRMNKMSTRVIEIPSESDLELPETRVLEPDELQVFMRKLAQTRGVDLMTLPTIVVRNGEEGAIEMGREFISPVEGAEKEFKSEMVGTVIKFQSGELSFGQEVDMDFCHKTGDFELAKPVIEERSRIVDSGYLREGSTRLNVQQREDGSRTLVIVTPRLIDATGRPLAPTR